MILGGIADKLGNRYEAKWVVRSLIDVIADKADWLKFESVETEYRGFEFAVGVGGVIQWHQTKVNAPTGNWTINALNKEGVLKAFSNRLAASEIAHCYFVSQDSAKDLRTLTEKARLSNALDDYLQMLSQNQTDAFLQVKNIWKQSDEVSHDWLKRSYIEVIPERELDSFIGSYGDFYFLNDGACVFPNLRELLEKHFNKELTTKSVREAIKSQGTLNIKEWALDPTIPQQLHDETEAYLNTYTPFGAGGTTIEREHVNALVDAITETNNKDLIMVSGVAGSGKSGIIRGTIQKLRDQGIPHLAFRVDHHLSCCTREELGEHLTRRRESPVSTLKGAFPTTPSVLFIDQVDAVSEVSGRDGQIKEALFRLISDAHIFGNVKVVVICRTFDLESDPRLKALNEKNRTVTISIPLLDWSTDVEPTLRNKGFDPNSFNEPQRDMLCLPVNLAVFLEIGDPSFEFHSRSNLHEKLIEIKQRTITRERSVSWSLVQALAAICDWMSQRQMLNAPVSVLDAYPNAVDILTSEGLVVSSRGQVNFFHESFFDHVYARSFVNNDQNLIDMLSSMEQHLFRRTQVRQILEALRQNDSLKYYGELELILLNNEVRFHIKVAVSQWLNSIDQPSEQEFEIINGLNSAEGKFHQFFVSAVLSSHAWFDRLYSNGWIKQQLEGEDAVRADQVLLWLSNIAGVRPVEVGSLWRSWWGEDEERASQLLSWFVYLRQAKPNNELMQICEDVINSHPSNLFDGRDRLIMVLDNWAEIHPEQSGRILRAIFNAWIALHPDTSLVERDELKGFDFHSLDEIAKKAPQALLLGMTDAIVYSVDKVIAEEEKGANWYNLNHRTRSGHRFGFDLLLGTYRSALKAVAKSHPDIAIQYLDQLDFNKCECLMHLHLEAIEGNPVALSCKLPRLAANEVVFNAGYDGAGWLSFSEACQASFSYLDKSQRHQIEKIILDYLPEINLAVEISNRVNREGEDAPWWTKKSAVRELNRSGYDQWCILETIGEELLSTSALLRLKELRRKFSSATIAEPRHLKGGFVGSPIKNDRCKLMKDHQWLSAIEHYDSEDHRRRERDFTFGGASQLAGELQLVTKENPKRFSNLCLQISDESNTVYIGNILRGLSETDEIPFQETIDAVKRAHKHPAKPFGDDIARLIGKHPLIASDSEILKILIWYSLNGDANDSNDSELQNIDRETISINSLLQRGDSFHIRGVNGARGWSWEALGAVLWKLPKAESAVWDAMSTALGKEELVSVRCCMMNPLTPLFNMNKEKFSDSIRRVIVLPDTLAIKNDAIRYAPLITYNSIHLFPYIFQHLPELAKELVFEMLESGDETTHLIGAWNVFCEGFRNDTYVEQSDQLVNMGVDHRRLLAGVTAEAVKWAENRHRSESLLKEFFFDEDEQVRKQAADAFRGVKPEEVEAYLVLAETFLKSPAFTDNGYAVLHMLENATCNVLGLVVEASEQVIKDIVEAGDQYAHRGTDVHQLDELLKREYVSSESNAEARKKILDLIDLMLMKEIYGVQNIISAHDRW